MKEETVKFGDFGLNNGRSLHHLKTLLREWFKVREGGAGSEGWGGVEKSAVILITMNSQVYRMKLNIRLEARGKRRMALEKEECFRYSKREFKILNI